MLGLHSPLQYLFIFFKCDFFVFTFYLLYLKRTTARSSSRNLNPTSDLVHVTLNIRSKCITPTPVLCQQKVVACLCGRFHTEWTFSMVFDVTCLQVITELDGLAPPPLVTLLCLCICRLIMTILWVSISVSSWSTLAIRGCAPMTCLGWPFTTLVNRLACCGGQGDHLDEGHGVMTWRGKSSGWREERTIYPPLLSNKNSGF